MLKKVTCGIIIQVAGKILLGHSTNNIHWDIPKGIQEEGESYKETALREVKEETGLVLSSEEVLSVGFFKLNQLKDIALFRVSLKEIDMSKLICSSMVIVEGGSFPELDYFRLFEKEDVLTNVSKSMAVVLRGVIFEN